MMTYQEILDYAASHGFDIPADCRRLIRQLSALFLVDEGERLRLYGAKREGASTWGSQYGFTFYRDNPPACWSDLLPAADIQGVRRDADPGGPIRQGPLHRRRIGVHGLVGGRVGIKIAVGALGQAEGHMDIQADGLHPDHLQKKRAIPAVIGTV